MEGADIRTLPIGPEEAFVLSRVDGSTRESELCAATGLDEARIEEILGRLKKLGAIQFLDEPTREPVQPRPHPAPTGLHRLNRTIVEAVKAPPSPNQPSALYDPSELDEPVDLVVERRRRILDVFYKLDTLTHYQIFELPRDADRKAIKAAYFDAVNVFHPDRYFGKNLGSFKSKLERVFARITEAHDVLTRAASRAEYDEYLAAQTMTRELERAIEESERGDQLEATLRELQVRALRDDGASATDSPDLGVRSTPEYDMAPDPDARRRAISRKLRAVSRGAAARPRAEPLSAEEQKRQALLSLRARHEGRVNQARQQQIDQYVKMADEALAARKFVSATTTLRLAVQLSGNDPALRARLEEAEQQAHAELSDTYLAQGAYEERTGRFLDATRSYEKAARGKPEAKLFDKVAQCALRAGNELHTAVEFGRKAVRAEPGSVRYRQTLIQAYLGAGLKSSAMAEIERLEAMNPEGREIKDWLKRAKHGEL